MTTLAYTALSLNVCDSLPVPRILAFYSWLFHYWNSSSDSKISLFASVDVLFFPPCLQAIYKHLSSTFFSLTVTFLSLALHLLCVYLSSLWRTTSLVLSSFQEVVALATFSISFLSCAIDLNFPLLSPYSWPEKCAWKLLVSLAKFTLKSQYMFVMLSFLLL